MGRSLTSENVDKAKKLTLNSAFKKYFGEILEPMGFVYKVINKHPYFIKIINDEIIQSLSIRQLSAIKTGYKSFYITYNIKSMYCKTAITPNSLNDAFPFSSSLQTRTDEDYEKLGLELVKRIYKTNYDFFIEEKFDWSGYTNEEAKQLIEKDRKKYGKLARLGDLQFNPDYLDQMELAVDCAKKLVIPEFERVRDLESCVDFYYEKRYYNIISIELADFVIAKNCHNASLMTIVADYDKNITKYIEKAVEQEVWDLNHGSGLGFAKDIDDYIERFRKLQEYMLTIRKKILNTPELKERALQMAEEFRQNNLEVLRSCGIKI